MKDRKKRTLILGILCCLLVFMGVGFAVMNATLNINGTATAINTWDVRMTKIEVTEKSDGATNEEETKINDDGVTATFKTDFTKPRDFITYKVTIENKGSIDAVLNDISITLNVSEADKDLFNITDTRPNNQLLEAGTSTTFTIKVEFRSDADRMPNGDIEYVVKVDYSQQTGEVGGEEEYEDWLYKIDESGTITAYNYNSKLVEDTSIAVVPATIDGIPVKTINEYSFLKFNALMFINESNGTGGFIIYDSKNYDAIVEKVDEAINEMGSEAEGLRNYYHEGDTNIPADVQMQPVYLDITKSGMEILGTSQRTLTKLDLSQCIYLEAIDENSFESDSGEDEIRLKEVIFPASGVLKTIGSHAFYQNNLTNVYIPSSVETIGESAFAHDASVTHSIKTVTFGENSKLTTIGEEAFFDNTISELIIPSSVTEIGYRAFFNQYDLGGRYLKSISIKRTKEDFLNNVTTGEEWFDDTLITENDIQYLG